MEEFINLLSQFISTTGFPIVACCVMFYNNKNLTETLNRNTLALSQLATILGKEEVFGNDEK